MNFEEQNKPDNKSVQDAQVADALRHFRESIHSWSGTEYAKPRLLGQTPRSSVWSRIAIGMTSPLLGWSFSAIVLAASIGVPVSMHHQHVVEAQKQAALQFEQKQAAEKAEQARIAAIDDDELMSHVDSDIAQDAPDAMQALSSLMSSSNE